ncbi:MAG: hypothetical protein KatS3mg034_0147 [Vicingaceae bacterium]|nr:MAG: hypothetical protein KatS3mg034_0147 [Vicingaceae bacterium]
MKKALFLFTSVMFVFSSLTSQTNLTVQKNDIENPHDWVSMMQDPNVNFYEIQKTFNEYWKGKDHTEKGKGWKQFKRWEWFMEPRVYPHGDRNIMNRAMLQFYANQKKEKGTNDKAANWTYIGNTSVPSGGGGAGRLNCVRFHPTNTNTYFVGAPAGGLWKTTNGGSSWSNVNTDLLASIGCSDLAIHPGNPNIMYLATGDGDAGDTYSIGVLKTTDGGNTWNPTGLSWTVQQTRRIRKLIMNPLNPNTLLAATSNGVYKTNNAGNTWTQVQTGSFYDIEYKPNDTTVVYACTDQFYKSTNGGASFTLITSGLPSASASIRMAIAVTPANASYVYVLVGSQTDYGFYGFYRSTNSGTSFTLMANSPNLLGWSSTGNDQGGQAWYDLAIAASPTNANTVVVGGINIWKTTNGGSSWSLIGHWTGSGGADYVHADIHDLIFYPNNGSTIFAATDGGIFKTTDGGVNWVDISSNLPIAQIYRLGLSVTDANKVITGWQDNGTNLKNNTTWSRVIGGDGMECIIDYTNANIMYGELYYGNIRKSTNGGSSWTTIVSTGGTGVDADGDWVTPYVMHPTNNQTLLVGKAGVYVTTNGGSSWSALGTLSGGSGNVKAIAYAPSNPNVIYVAKQNALFKSTNGGTSFTNITSGLPVSSASITYIAVSNTDPNRVYVTFSGYSSANKVYLSTNGGSSWTNFSTGLPNLPVNCIVYENGSPNRVYVGTDVGVYVRDDNMSSWQAYNTGLPNVIVNELEIHYGAGKIRAATYGRGLWESDLYTSPNSPPVANFTATPTTGCPGTIVQFTDLSSGNPTSWSWTISPSTGFTYVSGTNSSSQNPIVQFNTAGTYSVTLTATNSNGSNSFTQTNYITIQNSINLPFTKDFQNATFPPPNIFIIDGGNDGFVWELSTSAGGYGNSTQSAFFDNYTNNAQGAFDAMITSPLNFSGYSTVTMTFDLAYARYNATYSDTLEILVSTDCGQTYTSIWMQGGSTLATAPDNTNAFTPTSTQWTTKSINLNAFAGQSSVVVAFRNRGHWGNNMYIDNINIQGSVSGSPPTAAMSVQGTAKCPGDCLNFSDNSTNNPTSWQWTFPGGTPAGSTQQNPGNVCFNAPGTYVCTLTVSNQYGSSSATYNVVINANPNINVSPANPSICSGTGVTLNATGAQTYTWSPSTGLSATSGSSVLAAPMNTTTYTVNGTDANGCSGSTNVTVTVNNNPPTPTITQSGNILMCSLAGYSYQWYLNGNPIPGATGQTLTITQPGTYTVTITDNNGCSSTSAPFNVNTTDLANYSTGTIALYPNPSTGFFTLKSPDPIKTIILYDALGKEIIKLNGNNSTVIDLNFNVADGIYWLNVYTQQQLFIEKVLIKN